MNALSNELRAVIARHVERAPPRDVVGIVRALINSDAVDMLGKLEEASANADRVVEAIQCGRRFQVIDADQALDRTTNLIWTRKNVASSRLNWKDANDACAKLELGGESGWRLPTIRELLSLVDYERHEPAIDTDVFACESAWYWTSTPAAPSPSDCAWYVNFYNGSAGWLYHDDDGFVRAVRPGQ